MRHRVQGVLVRRESKVKRTADIRQIVLDTNYLFYGGQLTGPVTLDECEYEAGVKRWSGPRGGKDYKDRAQVGK